MSLSKREFERQATPPVEQVEETRGLVKAALAAAEEGNMDGRTFDAIARPLVMALRGLDELALTLAALIRRAS